MLKGSQQPCSGVPVVPGVDLNRCGYCKLQKPFNVIFSIVHNQYQYKGQKARLEDV